MPQDFTAGQVLTAAQMDTLSGAVDGYATTATAAGTTTLTVASLYQQFFTGSTTQTVVMPVASALYVGQKWRIVNNSSGVVTVQSSGANTIYAVPAGGDVIFTCILASGTTAASWDYKNSIQSASGGLVLVKARTTFSAVADTGTTFDSIFSSTYKTYLVRIEDWATATAADDPQMQMLYSGSTQASGYYAGSSGTDYSAGTFLSQVNNNTTQCTFWRSIGTPEGTFMELWFDGVGTGSDVANWHGTGLESDNVEMYVTGGKASVARTYTGIKLKSSSGNISGSVTVYGLAVS